MPEEKYNCLIRGFGRKNQLEFAKNFFRNRFFEDFEYVLYTHGNDYATNIYKYLNPSFVSSEKVNLIFYKEH
jgi:pentatricopeptide repeat protein